MPLRNDRRRRFLSDDSETFTDDEPTSAVRLGPRDEPPEAAAADSYTDGGRRACARPAASLVPTRPLSIALAALVFLAAVGGCLALEAAAQALGARWPSLDLAGLRFGEAGAIDGWLASILLAGCGTLCLFVYSLRCHRLDDYHGRYRVWIWIGLASFGLSLAETTHLGRLARGVSDLVAGCLAIRGGLLWSGGLATVAVLGVVRLFFEIRRCRAAIAGLCATALLFALAAGAYHGWPFDAAVRPAWARGAWLAGYVLILTTLLLYTRHVQLEIAGTIRVPKRARRTKASRHAARVDEAETSAGPPLRLRSDLDPVEKPQAVKPAERPAASSPPLQQHLSRAERKRLRRESRMAS
jgi:hypothetical protein